MEQSPAEIELAKIKAQNKARQAKYLEKRRAEGKRHLSAMVSGETYDKLCRLRDQSIQAGEKKNLGEVLDELLNDHTATGQDQGSQIREEPIKAIANQIVQDIEEHCREDHQTEEPASPKPVENQGEMFDESAPDQTDRPAIIKTFENYRSAGDSWPTIAKKLNALGIKTGRGKQWTGVNAQAFYSRNKGAK